MKKIIVAIDGFSACGKSTLAKDLAAKVGYTYIDSGAMYRAMAYYAINTLKCQLVDGLLDITACKDKLLSHLENFQLRFERKDEIQHTILNSVDIENAIRTPLIGQNASQIGTLKEIRQFLVKMQQQMGENKQIVMDGRDIGTVVFPNAELKLFLTASTDVRIARRYNQLYAHQERDENLIKQIEKELRERDYRDTHRDESPLKQAPDAVLIDNSAMTRTEQLNTVLTLFKKQLAE